MLQNSKLAFAAIALLALHNHNQVALADESDSNAEDGVESAAGISSY